MCTHGQLVGGFFATPLKNMSSSIGMISNPIYGKIKNGNQTTNQKETLGCFVPFLIHDKQNSPHLDKARVAQFDINLGADENRPLHFLYNYSIAKYDQPKADFRLALIPYLNGIHHHL